MSETVTFRVGDDIDTFEVTVKAEFAQLVPNYATLDFFTLATEHGLYKFLHNPAGPAMRHFPSNEEEYWINGKGLVGQDAEKIKHAVGFHDKFEKSLSEE